MTQIYNVYCDESCHLENDHQKVMTLGAIWCPIEKVKEITEQIKEIQKKYNLAPNFEIKWTKVSPAKVDFYLELIDYFFNNKDLHFRVLVIPDKSKLNHQEFSQNHDEWYYKMYFTMLKAILTQSDRYRIYIDIKDTRGREKTDKLHEVLSNNMYDFSRQIVERMQTVRSDEVKILQLCDLLIGAVSYANRKLDHSSAKQALIEQIRLRSGYCLTKKTLLREDKVNIFIWDAA